MSKTRRCKLTSSKTSANTPSAFGCSPSVGAAPAEAPAAPENMLAKFAKKFAEELGSLVRSLVDREA